MQLVLEEKVMRFIRAYGPQEERSDCKEVQFYSKMPSERDLQNLGEIILGLGDFNGNVRRIDSFEGVHDKCEIGERNVERRRLLEFCDKKSCAWQIKGFKVSRRK